MDSAIFQAMDSEQLDKLEAKVEEYMRRTWMTDVILAGISACFLAFVGGFILGTSCEEMYLSKCITYSVHPFEMAVGAIAGGAAGFWTSYKSLRAARRRKRWWG